MILVTGGHGMVGTALQEVAPAAYFTSTVEYDLRSPRDTDALFNKCRPDNVIHLAARVGGIKANMEKMGEFYHDNIMMNTNVLEACRKYKVGKVVSVLSTCIYPDKASYPLSESQIHAGPPHESNFAYAYAKRMLDIQSRAYRKQYGCNYITAVPNNLFGEADNYDLNNSHVIPAIIHKMYDAKQAGTDVELWGDGTPLREFTYSKDAARALLLLLEGYNDAAPINIGNPSEVSIAYIADSVAQIIGFYGKIRWRDDMPIGQHRKPSNSSKFQQLFNMKYTNIDISLRNACEWFIMNYPNVRGVK